MNLSLKASAFGAACTALSFFGFDFPFYAWRRVGFAAFDFAQNTVLFTLAFKAFEGFFQVFSVSYFYKNHLLFHHLLWSIVQNEYLYIIGYFI